MDLNQLQGFVTIVHEGTFTRAAERLFLTQPALSLQIKALEEELGAPLFERRNRQVFLTEAGRTVFDRAEHLLALAGQIRQDIDALQGPHSGRLNIGASDTTCLYVLPPLVQQFRSRFPGVEIHLTNRPSGEIVELLKTGAVDFGIVTLPVADSQVESERLFWREDVAICRRGHPLANQAEIDLADLNQYPLLLLEQGSTSRALLDGLFAAAGLAPQVIDLGSIEVIKRYVEIDLGISVVPALSVAEEVRAARLCALRLPWLLRRGVGLVQRRRGYLSPASQMFLRMLRDHIESQRGEYERTV
jgi:DNA-binding transcriptional LysR family regulator